MPWGRGKVDPDGHSRGFWLHSTLAIRLNFVDDISDQNTAEVLGLLQQKAWARDEKKKPRKRARSSGWPGPAKIARLAAALANSTPRNRPGVSMWPIGRATSGKSSDNRQNSGVSWVIRAAQDRALADDGGRVRAALGAMSVQETRLVELPRARGSPAARPNWSCVTAG